MLLEVEKDWPNALGRGEPLRSLHVIGIAQKALWFFKKLGRDMVRFEGRY